MNYLQALVKEQQERGERLGWLKATPKPVKVYVRYLDPDIAKINKILNAACSYYDYSQRVICGHSRNKRVGFIRNMIFYICVYLYGIPLKKVAKRMSTHYDCVRHGRDRIKVRLTNETAVAGDLRDIRNIL